MPKLPLSSSKPLVISLAVAVLLVLAVLPTYYFYNKYQESQKLLKNPTEAAREEVRLLTKRVGQHIELPNEEPTVATVSDKDKLKDQPFFARAENGDKVLIYTEARKAILFRPAIARIIEVSTVNLGGVAGATSSLDLANLNLKLTLYNGTETSGLTAKAEKLLKEKIVKLEVLGRQDAQRRDYDQTIIVALSQSRLSEAKALAEFLGATVSPLPAGEKEPDGDVLIILGRDFVKR